MDYLKHYNRLIETRKIRIPITGIYYEKHHIVMKSMGGSNDKGNLVLLTAREHFLAHWLLWRIYKSKETAFAFHSMCRQTNKQQRILSSRSYAEAREVNANAMSLLNKGKKLSEEHKKKLSVINTGKTGRKNSEETKKKMRESSKNSQLVLLARKKQIGSIRSDETKMKMSKSSKGHKRALGLIRSDETKDKISKSNIGKHSVKGRKHSAETKLKMSNSAKLFRKNNPRKNAS